jgi:hypothetical protein
MAAWDRQEGEPAAAYARFLRYRNLGPGRSVAAAYVAGTSRHKKACDGPPGSWGREAARWRWVERADAWDVHVGLDLGEHAIAAQLALVDAMARRAQQMALRSEPRTWKELLATLEALARAIPPEAVAVLLTRLAAPQAA